jgi:hypothetical protein
MLLHRRNPAAPAPSAQPTGQAERSHTLVPLVDPATLAWPIHARRCLKHLPEQLHWATRVLDPEHPGELDCTAEQARELLLWLHHRPSYELLIVGCHPRRPA